MTSLLRGGNGAAPQTALSMDGTPSLHPSPPAGESVPEGRVRGHSDSCRLCAVEKPSPPPPRSAGLGERQTVAQSQAARREIEFALDANSLWRVEGKVRGLRIDCRHGRLWITQEGSVADMILLPGESFVATDDGAVVVQSVSSKGNTRELSAIDGDIAFGEASVPGSVRLKISRTSKAVTRTRIGFDPVEGDPTASWERLAYAILWGCGLVGLAHCFRTAVWLM